MGITSSTRSKVTRSAGPIASRSSIAVYRRRIYCSTSASVTRRCPAAISRSRMTWASVLWGWQHRSGTWECSNRRKSTLVPSFSFAQHLLKVGGGERVLRTSANRLQFRFGPDYRPARSCFSKRAPNPFTNRQLFPLGQSLDVRHFAVGKQDLKALTHSMSMSMHNHQGSTRMNSVQWFQSHER